MVINQSSFRGGAVAVLLLLMLLLPSCLVDNGYNKHIDLEEPIWLENQVLTYDITPIDTLQRGSITLNLRYFREVQGDTLKLELITRNSKSSRYLRDTLTFGLIKGVGDNIRSIEVLYRDNVVWQSLSHYSISLRPLKPIDGIVSVNLMIDNAKQAASDEQNNEE